MVVTSIQLELACVHEKKHEKPAAAGPCFIPTAVVKLRRYSTPACCAKWNEGKEIKRENSKNAKQK
jgi:hypothetical protein